MNLLDLFKVDDIKAVELSKIQAGHIINSVSFQEYLHKVINDDRLQENEKMMFSFAIGVMMVSEWESHNSLETSSDLMRMLKAFTLS